MPAICVLEYLDASGRSPLRRWFDGLDATAAARVGGKDGETVVILLGGSAKKGQDTAIKAALKAWPDYKRRKKG